jgi:hypothetical protein
MALTMARTGYKASTVLASHNVMKFLILNGDGNVSIQTKNYPHPADPDGVTEEVRLYCAKCQASKHFAFTAMFDESALLQELEWAKNHKHEDGKTLIIAQDEVPVAPEGDRKLKAIQ